jgi:hypothetical protein
MTKFDERKRAETKLFETQPSASDQTFAEVMADYLVAASLCYSRVCRLGINHNISKPGTIYAPSVHRDERSGPCPLSYNWRYKNLVGISTPDAEHARAWAIEALLLGYSVFRPNRGSRGAGSGMGTIAEFRKTLLKNAEH